MEFGCGCGKGFGLRMSGARFIPMVLRGTLRPEGHRLTSAASTTYPLISVNMEEGRDSHNGVRSSTIPIPHPPKFRLALEYQLCTYPLIRQTHRNIPHFHRDVPLPYLAQIKRYCRDHILTPLIGRQDVHESDW